MSRIAVVLLSLATHMVVVVATAVVYNELTEGASPFCSAANDF